MNRLINISNRAVNNVPVEFERYLSSKIDWKNKMIAISGARGCGKTILLLQRMKEVIRNDKKSLYVSLDDVYFSENRLIYFAEEFSQNGGEVLFLDEVHKYKNWSQELKNIYDGIPDLKVVFTSSSALEIYRGSHDLSRRALVYQLAGLSFREFILFKYNKNFPILTLAQVIENKSKITSKIVSEVKIIVLFKEYLKEGYYPFFNEVNSNYLKQLSATVNVVLENDLPSIHPLDFNGVIKLKKLLYIMARIVPYKPNIENLAKQIETTRPTLLKYLFFLDKAQIIRILGKDSFGINYLNKPDKIYLANPNLAYTFGDDIVNIGNIRETFFLNQLSVNHKVSYPKKGDFLVDDKFTFEVGGKNKDAKQIQGVSNSFLAKDNIEFGYKNETPLWLFGFLY